jgi:hypothetical protein
MLRQMLLYTALVGSAFSGSANASGPEYGSNEEARAMLVRAIAAVKANQPEAIARFNHNDPEFRDRDLFAFCFNRQDGKFTAHEAMLTRDVRTFRDKNGTAYGKQMYDVATEGQMSEVAYFAPFPGSTEQVAKRAYVTGIGDQVCGVSAYRLDE